MNAAKQLLDYVEDSINLADELDFVEAHNAICRIHVLLKNTVEEAANLYAKRGARLSERTVFAEEYSGSAHRANDAFNVIFTQEYMGLLRGKARKADNMGTAAGVGTATVLRMTCKRFRIYATQLSDLATAAGLE